MSGWKRIPCLRKDLQLLPMLLGGQSFRWAKIEEDQYVGVHRDTVWELIQDDNSIQLKAHRKKNTSSNDDEKTMKEYLRLDTNLTELYKSWSQKDENFRKVSEKFYAVRMLNQEVIENVFSFICSSNNNITRISSMVQKLSKMYGSYIATLYGTEYYSFPKASTLANSNVEEALRKAGFGYRAKFVYQTACKIKAIGENKWIDHITSLNYREAKEELMSLPGVGAKVADCICLMSLGHLEAIPVDTHVFQIASNHYLKHLKDKKSVTDKVYNEIGDHFRDLFGLYAGWAHTILFCDDLKAFKATTSKRKKSSAHDIKSSRKKKKNSLVN